MDTVCVVGTFRAPVAEISYFINYHVNSGIDHVFLFFDADDSTIEQLADRRKLTCFRCDDEHWRNYIKVSSVPESRMGKLIINEKQMINADIALYRARQMGLDWVIHIDSDELLYARDGIKTVLSRVSKDVDVVRFEILEAVPEEYEYENMFAQISLFRSCPRLYEGRLTLAKMLGCQKAFYQGEYFRGHLASKTAVRTTASIKGMGVHWPEKDENHTYKLVTVREIKLLHFDGCGFQSWKSKWTRRMGVLLENMRLRDNRIQQHEEFRRVLSEQPGKMREHYQKMNFIPENERRVLRKLGLLRDIRLDNRLFNNRQDN
jgi:hypothetical protein